MQLRRAIRGDRAVPAETASGELDRSRLIQAIRGAQRMDRAAAIGAVSLGCAVLLRTIAGSILAAAGSTIAALCWLTHPPRFRGGESVLFIIED